jgi:hypothetical protein
LHDLRSSPTPSNRRPTCDRLPTIDRRRRLQGFDGCGRPSCSVAPERGDRADRSAAPTGSSGTVDVVGSILGLQERLTALLRRAEAKRDLRTCLLALREARVMLETTARLTGQIAPDGALAGEHRFGQATGADAARSRILAKLLAIGRAPAA